MEFARNSDRSCGRRLGAGLYEKVLVLRCTCVLKAEVGDGTKTPQFHCGLGIWCLSRVKIVLWYHSTRPLVYGRETVIVRCLAPELPQMVTMNLLTKCGPFSVST